MLIDTSNTLVTHLFEKKIHLSFAGPCSPPSGLFITPVVVKLVKPFLNSASWAHQELRRKGKESQPALTKKYDS